MSDGELEDEVADLMRLFRGQLARHAALGTWAAPGGPSPRPILSPEPDEVVEAAGGRRSLPQIREELGECTRCKLHTTRRTIVFGVGAEDAPLMFVGEAPGEQEDRRGEPFVGPAGELLDKMIEAMGWRRQDVGFSTAITGTRVSPGRCLARTRRQPWHDSCAKS